MCVKTFKHLYAVKCGNRLRVGLRSKIIDLLMGLFRGAVFQPWRGARKLPISVHGAFPLLDGPFSYLGGPFPRIPSWAVFALEIP